MGTVPVTLRTEGGGSDARAALAGLSGCPRSLYVHVPFCAHKCHYCDFYSFVDSRDQQEAFTDALVAEMRGLASAFPGGRALETVFVGGGTPSLLRADLWERVLAALGECFDLTAIREGRGEFTVECNPESVTPELMRTLRAGGVDRVSIGAQSFHSGHLRTLERWHDPANVGRALALADGAGIRRRSVDLIYGVPGQTLGQWRDDLAAVLALDPGVEHVSCYALTYEPNTAMTKRLRAGEFEPAGDEAEAEMYDATVEVLGEAGFERYEVSNFARPGAESRHNMVYWRSHAWLAAGPSASAHAGGRRWKNVPRLGDWMEGVTRTGGFAPIVDYEGEDPRRALGERLMMGLRVREGVGEAEVIEAARALGRADGVRRTAERFVREGLLRKDGGRWAPTERGFHHVDGMASGFLAALEG